MIVQQCYDEGIADIDQKIKDLVIEVKDKNDGVCAIFAVSYLKRESNMEREIFGGTENLPGWVESELKLNLARQRFDNIRLIRESCKQ